MTSAAPRTPGPARTGLLTGWKVMRHDPDTGKAVSGADSRQRLTPSPGRVLTMPGGTWLGLDPDYVATHYAVHDRNVMLELRFARSDVLSGCLDDVEAELRVRAARIVGAVCLPAEP